MKKLPETGIHGGVQGACGKAGQGRPKQWCRRQGTGVKRPDPAQLGQSIRCGKADRGRNEGRDTGADGTVADASRERTVQDGKRNPNKATAYFAKDVL